MIIMMFVGKYNVEFLEKVNKYNLVLIERFSGDISIKKTRLYIFTDGLIDIKDILKKEEILDRLIKYKKNTKLNLGVSVNIQMV